ncbi:MAG TPA: hypothetical protein VJ579_00105 [Candidatus Paceibacterota bacterium]|nr:hypothetical protein [Candidatus Paceibacterota bacterium]
MPAINIHKRPITDLAADAIITTIGDGGGEKTFTDQAIMHLVGDHFHHRAEKRLPLPAGSAFKIERTQMYPVRFDNVIFVVDDGKLSIEDIVYNALTLADKELMRVVSIGIPRFDANKTTLFKPFEDACAAIRNAILLHHRDFPNSRLQIINIACNKSPLLYERAEKCCMQ